MCCSHWHAASSLNPDLHFKEARIAGNPKVATQVSWLASAWKLHVKLTTANLRFCHVQEAQAQLGNTAGGSAHAGMEFYRPIEGFLGATTSLGRYTGAGSPQGQVRD